MRFSSIHLIDVSVDGVRGDQIFIERALTVQVRIHPGKMEPEELFIELVIGKKGSDFTETSECFPLALVRQEKDGVLTFAADYTVRQNGAYAYGVRILPNHPHLATKQETGLVYWG